MPVQRQATPGPSRYNPYHDASIGYPGKLSPGLLLAQPWPELVPEPQQAAPRRRGRPPINRANRPNRAEKVYQSIITVIYDQSRAPEIFHHLEDNSNSDMMAKAVANTILIKEYATMQEFRAYYTIGYRLDVALENEPINQNPFPSWTTIRVQYNLSRRQIAIGRRIYQLFRLWPDALERIKGLQIVDIEKLTDEEYQINVIRLVMSEPANQYQPLPML